MIRKLVSVAVVVAALAFFDVVCGWGSIMVSSFTEDAAHPLFPPFEVTEGHVRDVGENFTYVDDQGRSRRLSAEGERFFSMCLVKVKDPISGDLLILPPGKASPFSWIRFVENPFGPCRYGKK